MIYIYILYKKFLNVIKQKTFFIYYVNISKKNFFFILHKVNKYIFIFIL